MSIWDATRYGWTPIFWLTISGIPVVWTQRATGLTLPSGYTTEDASLTLRDCGDLGTEHIDRDRGLGVAMPMAFKLLDGATVRDWLRKGTYRAALTASLAAGGGTATVDDTTGWPASGSFFAGLERITYSGKTGTSFTGLTRATVGSLAYRHATGSTAQYLSERSQLWLGREVVLWATPCDASGYVSGATLASDAVQVWRGRLDKQPVREVDGFRFEALPLERLLDEQLVSGVTGRVVDAGQKYQVSTAWAFDVTLIAFDSAGAEVWSYAIHAEPFLADADGDLLSAEEIRARIVDAWDDGVTAAGATTDLSSLSWWLHQGKWKARVVVVNDATIVKVARWTTLAGAEVWFEAPDPSWPGGMSADSKIDIGWHHAGSPLQAYSTSGPTGIPGFAGLCVQLDEGSPDDVVAPGLVRLTAGDRSALYAYQVAGNSAGLLYLAGLLAGGTTAPLTAAELADADATVVYTSEDSFPDLMLRALEDSGTGLRGTYDVGAVRQGYGVPDTSIDEASFLAVSGPVGSLQGRSDPAGRSFVDCFGGLLGLFRKAVVCRPQATDTVRTQRLTLVDTAPFGSGWATTITDDDLLSHSGDAVSSVSRAEAPTVMKVTRPHGAGSDEVDTLTFTDQNASDIAGRREVEYEVPALDLAALRAVALPAARSHMAADQTAQAIELRVGPWVAAEAGDIVYLDGLTHPSLWTWSGSAGAVGYTGPGRVVGRLLDPNEVIVKLNVLIDGAVQCRALAPAMQVSAFSHATAPAWIEVPLMYLAHMTAALADAGAAVWLYHYQPGQTEVATQRHQISAVAEVAGVLRMTVVATAGGHTLSTANRSTLTLPTTDGGHLSTWQGTFAHVDDGTDWA